MFVGRSVCQSHHITSYFSVSAAAHSSVTVGGGVVYMALFACLLLSYHINLHFHFLVIVCSRLNNVDIPMPLPTLDPPPPIPFQLLVPGC